MKEILTGVIFVIVLNSLVFMAQSVTDNLNPEEINFVNFDDSFVSSYDINEDANNYTIKNTFIDDLPDSDGTVSADSDGNIFTDLFKAVKNWISETTGLKYINNFINAVPNFLKGLGLPNEIAFALGVIWHSLAFFIVVLWLKE